MTHWNLTKSGLKRCQTERTAVNVWADLLKQPPPRPSTRLAPIPAEIHCYGFRLFSHSEEMPLNISHASYTKQQILKYERKSTRRLEIPARFENIGRRPKGAGTRKGQLIIGTPISVQRENGNNSTKTYRHAFRRS